MGFDAVIRLCNICNSYDWFVRIHWVESNSNFIKLYCFNVNTQHGNEYSFDSRFLQLKKEFPELSKSEAVLKASHKMLLPILYTVLTTICAFLSLVFQRN